jgi:hypothetical protein
LLAVEGELLPCGLCFLVAIYASGFIYIQRFQPPVNFFS